MHCYKCKGVIVKILIETHKIQDQRSYHWWTESKCCASTSIQCSCMFLFESMLKNKIVSVDCYVSPNIQKKLGKEVKCTKHLGVIV